jgi:hypothetical protein
MNIVKKSLPSSKLQAIRPYPEADQNTTSHIFYKSQLLIILPLTPNQLYVSVLI